jgi:hypothetical protein
VLLALLLLSEVSEPLFLPFPFPFPFPLPLHLPPLFGVGARGGGVVG